MEAVKEKVEGRVSTVDRVLDFFAEPRWKNLYLRYFIISYLILNMDSIAALTSNYKLHRFMTETMVNGERAFAFAEMVDLNGWWKLAISLGSPVIWFAMHIGSGRLVILFNRQSSYFESETSHHQAIKALHAKNSKLSETIEKMKGKSSSYESYLRDDNNRLQLQYEKVYLLALKLDKRLTDIGLSTDQYYGEVLNQRLNGYDAERLKSYFSDQHQDLYSRFLKREVSRAYDELYGQPLESPDNGQEEHDEAQEQMRDDEARVEALKNLFK